MVKGHAHSGRINHINRRCCKCRKLAKDFVNGEYLCRIHSPQRLGYIEKNTMEQLE